LKAHPRLRFNDLIATILFAAIAVPYAGYLLNGEMPFVKDPRGMAATGLVLGAIAFLVMRRDDLFDRVGKAETAMAVLALVLGLVALALAETAAAAFITDSQRTALGRPRHRGGRRGT
jgi:hypothetical protein